MTSSLGQIKSAQSALTKLLNADLPAKTSYRLSKLAKRVADEFQQHEQQRMKLVEKFGSASEDGKDITVLPENSAAFFKEYEELNALEVEVPDQVSVLLDDSVKLSALDMAQLTPFVKWEEK